MQIAGIVRKTEDRKAFVVIKRETACGDNCAECGGCSSAENEIEAINDIGAERGDCVTVEMEDSKVIAAAFFAYMLPIIIFLLIYCTVSCFNGGEALQIAAGVGGVALFYVVLHYCDRRKKEKYIHRIIRVDEKKGIL